MILIFLGRRVAAQSFLVEAFEAWFAYLFGGSRDAWLTQYAASDTPVATAERIRRLFGNAGELLRGYTDDQVAQGLIEIVDGGVIYVLGSKDVPVVQRTRGLRSIVTLFAEVFAPRITVEQEKRVPPLQYICFMFFDVAPLDLADETVLDVLEDTLALPSVPCQRAALHGLGHAHLRSPQDVEMIVDRWLARNRGAPQELRDYAASARVGGVM